MSERRKSTLRDLVETVAIALVIALVVRYFIVEVYVVEGPSMENTLHTDERLIVNKLSYRFSEPARGDIIVFRYPGDVEGKTKLPPWLYCLTHQCKDFVKRVVAVSGDTVEIRGGQVYANGELQPDPELARKDGANRRPQRVPPGSVWVMGDNRRNSEDSRVFGPVRLEYVKGKAALRFWPLGAWRVLAGPRPLEHT